MGGQWVTIFRWAQGWLFLVICDRNHVKKVKCAKLEFMSSLLGLKILSCEAEFSCLSLVDLVWTGGVRKKSTAKKVSIFFSLSLSTPIHFCFVMPNPHTWALEQSVNNVTIISFLIFHVWIFKELYALLLA